MSKQLHVGTSGWVYDHWEGPFYPDDLPQEEWFDYYAARFDTVEINNSFYQLPSEETFENWRDQAPDGFCYSVKANRYLTHMKNLKPSNGSLENFLSRTRLLESHLGPILWQLPPNWHANPERLESFAAHLPDELDHVFEFRDPDWFRDSVRKVLEEFDLGFVIYTMPGIKCPRWITADPIYLRFHGVQGQYTGRYGEDRLRPWVDDIHSWLDQGHRIFAYFNNDDQGFAVEDARTLISLLEA